MADTEQLLRINKRIPMGSQKVQVSRNLEEISKLKLFGFRIVKAM